MQNTKGRKSSNWVKSYAISLDCTQSLYRLNFHKNIISKYVVYESFLMMLRTFTLLSKTFSSVKAPSCSNFSVSGYNLYSTDQKIRFYIGTYRTQNGFNPFLTEHFKFFRPVFLQEISSIFLFTGKSLSEALIFAFVQATHNKTTDFSLNYEFSTRKLKDWFLI